MKKEVQNFLEHDSIDMAKFFANLEIMKNFTKEIYKSSAQLLRQKDVSANATESIEWVASPLNQPLGYPVWFMAAYPDVVKWASYLDDSQIISVIGEPPQSFLDTDNYFKFPILRKIVDSYRNENMLECGRP